MVGINKTGATLRISEIVGPTGVPPSIASSSDSPTGLSTTRPLELRYMGVDDLPPALLLKPEKCITTPDLFPSVNSFNDA